MDRYGTVLLIGLNLFFTFGCISSEDATATISTAVPSLLSSLLTGSSSIANGINNHNRSVNVNALKDEPITQTVSQSQYYYYQQRLFRPKVNLRISSEYGIVRQPAQNDDEYYAYATVGAASSISSSPNSIIDERDKDDKAKGRYFAEKVIEPQQSALESPAHVEQPYLYSPEDDNARNHNHNQHQQQPSRSLQPMSPPRVSYDVDVDPTASSSSLLDTSNANDKSEKSNAIVENEPSSANAASASSSDGDNNEDDYSNYYHYADDDYQQQQYSHSFPDYTDDDGELLENEADQAEIHNQYFVKTKPRDVITQLETSLLPLPLTKDEHSYSYKEDPFEQRLVNGTGTGTKATAITPTTMQDSSDFYENMSTTINKANIPHSMKFEMPSSVPTMASAQDESTKMQDEPMYGLMMTPTIASNLIADVTRKFGSTDSTSIPGMPGIDYPVLDEIPQTSFDCQKQRYKGFFADVETKCQAWHYCDFIDGHSTFLCPNGTLFSQTLLTCDWWFNVRCEESQQLYVLNERLYRYIKAPKLSFPEDYHGPHVDDWLLEQLQLGLLPKIKKKVKDKVVIQGNYS